MYELFFILILLAVFLGWMGHGRRRTVVCCKLSNEKRRNRVASNDKLGFGSYVPPFNLEDMGNYIRNMCGGGRVVSTAERSQMFPRKVRGSKPMLRSKSSNLNSVCGVCVRRPRHGKNRDIVSNGTGFAVSGRASPKKVFSGRTKRNAVSPCVQPTCKVISQTFYNSKFVPKPKREVFEKKSVSPVITSTAPQHHSTTEPSLKFVSEKTVSMGYFTKFCKYGKDYKFSRSCASTDCDNVVISYNYIMGLICSVCKPAAGKKLTFFRFINKKINEKWWEWFCGCKECQDSDVTGCKTVRCVLCTTPKAVASSVFMSDGESEK